VFTFITVLLKILSALAISRPKSNVINVRIELLVLNYGEWQASVIVRRATCDSICC